MHANSMRMNRLIPPLIALAAFAAPVARAAPADPAIAYVAFSSAGQWRFELKVANADGTNRAVIWTRGASYGSSTLRDPAWSPDLDGNPTNGYQGTIAVSSLDGARGTDILYLIDVVVIGGVPRGVNVRELVAGDQDPGAGNVFDPEWSPDLDPITSGYQGKITFEGRVGDASSVQAIDVHWDGTTVQPTYGPSSSVALWYEPGAAGPRYPTWSPDGSRMAFKYSYGIRLLDVSSSVVTDAVSGLSDEPRDLQWSRTGSRVAYRWLGDGQLYTVDVDLGSGSVQPVTSEPCLVFDPTWSPDDRFLVFMERYCGKGQGYKTIRRTEISTGVTTTLIAEPKKDLWDPDWRRSP